MCIIARIIAHIVHNSTHNSAHNSDEIREISARYERDLNARDDVVASAVPCGENRGGEDGGGEGGGGKGSGYGLGRATVGSAVAWVANWRAGDAGGGL